MPQENDGMNSVERWKKIENYEGLHRISTQGRVWSEPRLGIRGRRIDGRYRKLTLNKKKGGYLYVPLADGRGGSKNHLIHRLVATAFIPNPENKPEVNHKDGNKTNNYVENLEWVTPKENGEHASRTGLVCKKDHHGNKNPKCRLSETDVSKILDSMIAGDGFMKDIAPEFNISIFTLFLIKKGDHWAIRKSESLREKVSILQNRGSYLLWLKAKMFSERS